MGCGSLDYVGHRKLMRLWRDFYHTQKDILLDFKYSQINPRGKVLQSVELSVPLSSRAIPLLAHVKMKALKIFLFIFN